jgi:hypothetical protein
VIVNLGCVVHIYKANKKWNQGKDIARLVIYKKRITDALLKYGCKPNKSLDMSIPVGIPNGYISHFIRGFYDGDGCISWRVRNKYMCVAITGQENICQWISEALPGIHMSQQSVRDNGTINMYIWSQSGIAMFMNYIYQDAELWLPAKKDKYLNMITQSDCKFWRNYNIKL